MRPKLLQKLDRNPNSLTYCLHLLMVTHFSATGAFYMHLPASLLPAVLQAPAALRADRRCWGALPGKDKVDSHPCFAELFKAAAIASWFGKVGSVCVGTCAGIAG